MLFFSFFSAITFPHAAVDNEMKEKKTTENKMQKNRAIAGSVFFFKFHKRINNLHNFDVQSCYSYFTSSIQRLQHCHLEQFHLVVVFSDLVLLERTSLVAVFQAALMLSSAVELYLDWCAILNSVNAYSTATL
jgi:hypothetical protein